MWERGWRREGEMRNLRAREREKRVIVTSLARDFLLPFDHLLNIGVLR